MGGGPDQNLKVVIFCSLTFICTTVSNFQVGWMVKLPKAFRLRVHHYAGETWRFMITYTSQLGGLGITSKYRLENAKGDLNPYPW